MVDQTSVCGGLSGLILSWANELTGHDSESTSAALSRELLHFDTCVHRTCVRSSMLQYVRVCHTDMVPHVSSTRVVILRASLTHGPAFSSLR